MHERLQTIFQLHSCERESLIPILQEVQGELGYLPPEAISEISQYLGMRLPKSPL